MYMHIYMYRVLQIFGNQTNKHTHYTTMVMMLVLNDIINHLLASKPKAWLIKPTPK